MDKGQRILLDYFWSNGWKRQPTISEQDFAIAKAEGYMFEPAEQEISHAETLERICAAVRKIEPADAANAFFVQPFDAQVGIQIGAGQLLVCGGDRTARKTIYGFGKLVRDLRLASADRSERHEFHAVQIRRVQPHKRGFCVVRFGAVCRNAQSRADAARYGDIQTHIGVRGAVGRYG